MVAFDDWRHARTGEQGKTNTGPNRITPRKLNTMLQKHSPCIPAVTNDSKEGLMYTLTHCATSNDACLAKCAKLLLDHDVPHHAVVLCPVHSIARSLRAWPPEAPAGPLDQA